MCRRMANSLAEYRMTNSLAEYGLIIGRKRAEKRLSKRQMFRAHGMKSMSNKQSAIYYFADYYYLTNSTVKLVPRSQRNWKCLCSLISKITYKWAKKTGRERRAKNK